MSDCPIVRTCNGKVKGRQCKLAKALDAKIVWNYNSIPYAQAPLRFEKAQKVEDWNGVYDATTLKAAPLQSKNLGRSYFENSVINNEFGDDFQNTSEDCLYLNVYTSNPDVDANMPVLFWVYGGGYQLGGTCGFNGQVLCGLHDIVLVVPTYRVNAFGFISCGKDSRWPGNLGIHDQIMALEWTRDNIRRFGGNPNNVTVSGESAGSISTSLLMMSPLSRNLFHKAICHSGTSNFPILVKENNEEAMKMFLEILNISETDPEIYMSILKSLPAQQLIDAQDDMAKKMCVFSVCVDDKIFFESPLQTLRKGEGSSKPLIVGSNNSEGDGILGMDDVPNFMKGLTEDECKKFITGILLETVDSDQIDEAVDEVIHEYMRSLDAEEKFKWTRIVGSFMRDTWFTMPTIEKAKIYSGDVNSSSTIT